VRQQACTYAAALIKEIEMGGSDVHRGSGMGSTREFRGIRDGSHNGVASPEDVEGAGPLWTVGRKAMWFVDQSINRLYCLNQLYPRTAEQEELSDVT
jgi:hypothetical protein